MSAARKDAWIWVPLANIGEGLPYAIINVVLVAMLADMQVDAGTAAFVASLCALPWSLKALWSPVVEAYGTRKGWMLKTLVTEMYLLIGLGFLPIVYFNLPLFALLAFLFAIVAATYDIACDGYYMRSLSTDNQAFFVGIRTTAYRIGMLLATGGAAALCGWCVSRGQSIGQGWTSAIVVLLVVFAVIWGFLSNEDVMIADPAGPGSFRFASLWQSYKEAVKTFFLSKGVKELCFMFAFLFLYRLGESLLSKVTILFLKDTAEQGGLALSNEQYGLLYGTCGVIALIVGGILGGMAISKFGLRRCILPMALAVNVPDLLYVWLSVSQQSSLWLVGSFISIEQFGYGFGLAAYTVYLMQCAKGAHETAHYAFLTAIMGLSLTLPSMLSGYLQQHMGYTEFFTTTCLFTIPGIILSIYYVCAHRS